MKTENKRIELKNKLMAMANDIAESVYCAAVIDGLECADSQEEAIENAIDKLNDGDFECDIESTVRDIIVAAWPHRDILCDDEDEESID